jgi:hypothetical protein
VAGLYLAHLHTIKLKLISCIVWVLGAFLVMATVDTLPDPPAVNSGTTASKILHSSKCSCDTSLPFAGTQFASYPFAPGLSVSDPYQFRRSNDPMIGIGHAADSSPPAPEFSGTLTFQI